MIYILVFAGGFLLWEYRFIYSQQKSLEVINAELSRRRALNEPLNRDEVPKLLWGRPAKVSQEGEYQHVDYFTWNGFLNASHIRVICSLEDEVLSAANDLMGPAADKPLPPNNAPVNPAVPESEDTDGQFIQPKYDYSQRVQEVLNHSAQLLKKVKWGWYSEEFERSLASVFDELPEISPSRLEKPVKWNAFQFPRERQQLFAFRIRMPTLMTPPIFAITSQNLGESGIFPLGQFGNNRLPWIYQSSWDIEHGGDIPGLSVPPDQDVYFRSFLTLDSPSRDYILWCMTPDKQIETEFRFDCAIFAFKMTPESMVRTADRISEFLNLNATFPHGRPGDVGSAIQLLDQRFSSTRPTGFILPGRILSSVRSELDELNCSDKPGVPAWQQISFSRGTTAALRARIPESAGSNVDIYGAVVSAQKIRMGWDRSGSPLDTREYPQAAIPGSPVPSPANLTYFAFNPGDDWAAPGTDFGLWFHQEEPTDDPVFVTLSMVPHGLVSRGENDNFGILRPSDCERVTGVHAPRPASDERSLVAGVHEWPVLFLKFTPDGSHLVSGDKKGMIQIWQADPPGTQPAIKLASSSDRVVALDSSRQALLVYDGRKYTLKRWDIANQQLLPPLGPSNPQFWNIKCAAIGPDSRFLALVHQSLSTRSQMEQSHEFSILDLEQKSPVKKAGIQRDSIYNNYHSMVYLPGVNMFALGRTRIADGAPNSGTAMMATVELWLPDFSKRIEELVIGKYEGSTQLSEAQTVRVYLDVAPNARRLAAGCERGDLVVWDIGSWTELTKLRVKPRTYDRASPVRYVPKVPRPLLGVSISPDGSHVASTEAFSDSVTVWNISDGTSRSAWKSDPIPSLIFDGYGPVRENTDEAEIIMADYSPDGKRIATADAGGVIRIWNLSDEE